MGGDWERIKENEQLRRMLASLRWQGENGRGMVVMVVVVVVVAVAVCVWCACQCVCVRVVGAQGMSRSR